MNRFFIIVVGIIILVGVANYFIVNQRISLPAYVSMSTPKPITSLSPTELKYLLENKLGLALLCSGMPSHTYSEYELLKLFPTVAVNTEEFPIILKHLNISTDGLLWTDQEKLAVVREHNRLSVISLDLSNGRYKFRFRSTFKATGWILYYGLITQGGSITIIEQKPSGMYPCPICLAENTFIDTPSGLVAVQNLQQGAEIWTLNKFGVRVLAKILETSRTPVPSAHKVIHLVIADGSELFVSPGHPTGDGRVIGDLSLGDSINGRHVVTASLIPYRKGFTYDILPSGETGLYWANGIIIGSTLFHQKYKSRQVIY